MIQLVFSHRETLNEQTEFFLEFSSSFTFYIWEQRNNDLSLFFSRVEIGSNRFEKSVEEEEKKSSRVSHLGWIRGGKVKKGKKIERPNRCWTILGKDTIKNDRESGETRMVGALRIYNISNDISRIRLQGET